MFTRPAIFRDVCVRLMAGVALISGGTAPVLAAPSEFAVKAAFLLRFGDFVSWPDGTFNDPSTPVAICIIGDNPFGTVLTETVKGQTIQGRPVTVVESPALSPELPCHIAYMAASSNQSVAARVKMVGDKPVLTVTDGQVDDATGIIRFVIRDNRVKFAIDPAAAKACGIEISSKLLALAINLKR